MQKRDGPVARRTVLVLQFISITLKNQKVNNFKLRP